MGINIVRDVLDLCEESEKNPYEPPKYKEPILDRGCLIAGLLVLSTFLIGFCVGGVFVGLMR